MRHTVCGETLNTALSRVARTVARDSDELRGFSGELFHPVGVERLGPMPRFLPAGRTLLTAAPETRTIAPSCTVLGPSHADRRLVLAQSTGIGSALDGLGRGADSLTALLARLGAEPQPDATGRRPGLMLTLRGTHPAAREFIHAKWRFYSQQQRGDGQNSQAQPLAQMNLSLRTPDGDEGDAFMRSDVFEAACRAAHAVGDPGMLFEGAVSEEPALLDATQPWRRSTATSPCGELWLHEGECCTLGNLVLPAFLRPRLASGGGGQLEFDWASLERSAGRAVQFLDGVIDCLVFPSDRLRAATRFYRRVGLGVMGWATCLKLLRIAYDSEEARALAAELAARVYAAALRSSEGLAARHGTELPPLPSLLDRHAARSGSDGGAHTDNSSSSSSIRRNVTVLALAPTGGTSHLVGVSSSIEPYFNDAHAVSAEAHLLMMAAFQRSVDNGVSKTVNLPNAATVEDVADVFREARRLGLKGVTVFRDGCLDCAPRAPVVCIDCDKLPH